MKSSVSNLAIAFGLYLHLSLVVLALPGNEARAQDVFDRRVEAIMSNWGAPGAIISIVKDGEVLLTRGYGTTRVEGGVTPDASTLVSVASVSKTFNSVVLGMLIEDGRLGLDDPVRSYIPEFQFSDSTTSKNATETVKRRLGTV